MDNVQHNILQGWPLFFQVITLPVLLYLNISYMALCIYRFFFLLSFQLKRFFFSPKHPHSLLLHFKLRCHFLNATYLKSLFKSIILFLQYNIYVFLLFISLLLLHLSHYMYCITLYTNFNLMLSIFSTLSTQYKLPKSDFHLSFKLYSECLEVMQSI